LWERGPKRPAPIKVEGKGKVGTRQPDEEKKTGGQN